MPDLLAHADAVVEARADLAELRATLHAGETSTLGGVPELKALEARVGEHLSWFEEQGAQVKGVAPLLLDFPSEVDGHSALLCWLEGERALGWYHRTELGFLGRRRLPDSEPPDG